MAVTERRAKVSELLRKGLRQVEIAEALGLGRGAAARMLVSRDLQAVREAWKASGVRDYEADRARLLDEIALGKKEAWAAWDASKADKDGNPRPPDVRYFNALLDCWKREADILGLSVPDLLLQQNNINASGRAEGGAAAVAMTPQQRAEAVRNILIAASRPEVGPCEAKTLLALMDAGEAEPLTVDAPAPEPVAEAVEAAPSNDQHGNGAYGGNGSRLPCGLRELPTDDAADDDAPPPLWGD
jgi:hypothetical protein